MTVFNVSYPIEIHAAKYTETKDGVFFEDADENVIATFPAGAVVTPSKTTEEDKAMYRFIEDAKR